MDLERHEITCVIRYTPETEENNSISCSAIWLSPSYILVPGCLLGYSVDSSILSTNSLKGQAVKGSFHLLRKTEDQISSDDVELVTFWNCKLLSKTIDSLFCPSNMSQGSSQDSDTRMNRSFLSLFLLLHIKENSDVNRNLQHYANHAADLQTGQGVMICSTPFGSTHFASFQNSWSSGIISNCVDKSSGTFLTDATCIPGCQGGLVFEKRSLLPAAVVIHPVMWKNDEATGLSLVSSLQVILNSLQDHMSFADLSLSECVIRMDVEYCYSNTPTASVPANRLVRVKNGRAWGSGIALSGNYVLTCAHVVKGHDLQQLAIILQNGEVNQGLVIYESNHPQLDIAVLRLKEQLQGVPMMKNPPLIFQGMEVISQGFSLFEDAASVATSGTIAKVHRYNSKAFILATTSRVSSGASGGTISNHSGEIIGMIVANTYDATNEITYTDVSFGISLEILYQAIKHLCSSGSTGIFIELENQLKDSPCSILSAKL